MLFMFSSWREYSVYLFISGNFQAYAEVEINVLNPVYVHLASTGFHVSPILLVSPQAPPIPQGILKQIPSTCH